MYALNQRHLFSVLDQIGSDEAVSATTIPEMIEAGIDSAKFITPSENSLKQSEEGNRGRNPRRKNTLPPPLWTVLEIC